MMYSTTISSKGQIVIPKAIRDLLGFQVGDRVKVGLVNKRVVVEKDDEVSKMMGKLPPKRKIKLTEEKIDEIIMAEVGRKYA